MTVNVGESESDDEGLLAPQKDAQPSVPALAPSAEEDTLTSGSTSTAQPFTDVSMPADSDTVTSPQQGAESQLQKHAQAEPHLQSQLQGWLQSQSGPNTESHTRHAATDPASVSSPFLDRLATAGGPSSGNASQCAQQPSHFSMASDTHTQGSSQSAAEPASAAPNKATDAQFEPNQARGHAAEEAQEERQHGQPSNAANPMAAGQALASNLAFQHELQQRSSERQARAGALLGNAEAGETAGRGDQGGQGAHQRGLRCCARVIRCFA